MKINQTIIFLMISFCIQAQSIVFGPTNTLFTLDTAHWVLSQPMIPTANSDGKHVDFYGLTGSTYKKHTYTDGSYTATSFVLFGSFYYITDVYDFDQDGKDDILTDSDIFKSKGDNIFQRFPFGFGYDVEGSLDYDGDGRQDVLITEDDSNSGLTSLYVFRNKGNFTFEKITIEQNKRKIETVVTTDINGDNRDDIIVSTRNESKPFTVFLSNVDGSFATRELEENDKYFLSHVLSFADMDKDGDLDIAVIDNEQGLWFFENRDGFVTSTKRKDTSFDAFKNGLLVHCEDLNGDGWPEMIVGSLTPTKLTIQVSKGTGPFEFDALKTIGNLSGGTSDFAPVGRAATRLLHTIDINADGKKDIVMTSTFDKKQVAWINNSVVTSGLGEILGELCLFPNPAKDYIHFENDVNLNVSIYNLLGMVILQKDIAPYESLPISLMESGAYMILLKDESGRSTSMKFVKE